MYFCTSVYFNTSEKRYFPLAEVRKKRKMFSHTLLRPDEIRVLAGGAGYSKHIFVVAREA